MQHIRRGRVTALRDQRPNCTDRGLAILELVAEEGALLDDCTSVREKMLTIDSKLDPSPPTARILPDLSTEEDRSKSLRRIEMFKLC